MRWAQSPLRAVTSSTCRSVTDQDQPQTIIMPMFCMVIVVGGCLLSGPCQRCALCGLQPGGCLATPPCVLCHPLRVLCHPSLCTLHDVYIYTGIPSGRLPFTLHAAHIRDKPHREEGVPRCTYTTTALLRRQAPDRRVAEPRPVHRGMQLPGERASERFPLFCFVPARRVRISNANLPDHPPTTIPLMCSMVIVVGCRACVTESHGGAVGRSGKLRNVS
jgi:hypothetical protein